MWCSDLLGGAFEFHCQFGQFVTMVEERKLLMEAYVRESLLEMYETNRQWLGNLDPEVMEEGFVRNSVVVPEKACNFFGNAFGGYLMSLVDVCGCAAPWTLGKYVVTQTCDVHFIRGVMLGEHVFIEARDVRTGRTSSIADVRIVDEQGNVRLTATVTMHIVRDIQPEDVGVQQKLE